MAKGRVIPEPQDINMRNNYWGFQSTEEVKRRIQDLRVGENDQRLPEKIKIIPIEYALIPNCLPQ
jgi:hypothetical protein